MASSGLDKDDFLMGVKDPTLCVADIAPILIRNNFLPEIASLNL